MELTATPLDLANVRLVVVLEVAGVAEMAVMVGTTAAATREEAVAELTAVPARHRRNWIRRWRTTGVETTPQLKLLRSNPRLLLPLNRRLPQPQRLLLLHPLPLTTIST
jgi:hypothetical protein